ncbi:MAG: hypothetical protein U0O22_02410 [Acutalibacteraceae bacterium]
MTKYILEIIVEFSIFSAVIMYITIQLFDSVIDYIESKLEDEDNDC